jgi:nucleoid-associated protein YgaU
VTVHENAAADGAAPARQYGATRARRARYTGKKKSFHTRYTAMASFEELKSKYQSVLQVVQNQQVHMANLHMENGKLLMRGTAPSQEAANAVWDEIKRINPKLDDVIADFPIDASLKVAARTYTVRSGDTLSKISKEVYGSPNEYMKIFNANKDKLSDPNKIQPGQELKIPA